MDVRTLAEWNFVGLPDLSPSAATCIASSGSAFPTWQPNSGFVAEASQALDEPARRGTPVLLICRSGARSRAAAIAMTQRALLRLSTSRAALKAIPMREGHRGQHQWMEGAGLPWRQG